jgi:hypothetical protein
MVAKLTKAKPGEKRFLLTPRMLEHFGGITTYPVHQKPSDIVISAAGATHGGFNLGQNYAEAVNFGDEVWLSMADEMLDFYGERDQGVPSCVLELCEPGLKHRD